MTSPTQTDATHLAFLQQRLRDNLAQAGRDLLELTLMARQMSGGDTDTERVRLLVIEVVSERFGMSALELLQRTRRRCIAHPRQLAVALFLELRTPVSHAETGRLFGGMGGAAVPHAARTVTNRCDAYPTEAAIRDELRAKIRERMTEGKS